MKAPSLLQRWRGLAALFTAASLLTAPTAGCAPEEDSVICPGVGCFNTVTLTGNVSAGEAGQPVEAKYCSAEQCIEGLLKLAPPGKKACMSGDDTTSNDSVCLALQADGTLQVEARLSRSGDGTPPKDGELYTLTLVDANSGSVLVEEARQADYETTAPTECPSCSSITIEL